MPILVYYVINFQTPEESEQLAALSAKQTEIQDKTTTKEMN